MTDTFSREPSLAPMDEAAPSNLVAASKAATDNETKLTELRQTLARLDHEFEHSSADPAETLKAKRASEAQITDCQSLAPVLSARREAARRTYITATGDTYRPVVEWAKGARLHAAQMRLNAAEMVADADALTERANRSILHAKAAGLTTLAGLDPNQLGPRVRPADGGMKLLWPDVAEEQSLFQGV